MKDSIENYVTKKLVSSDYLKNSRYRELYALTYPDGLTLLETTPQTYIKTSIDDLLHTVTAAETNRLDLVAYKYYGNPLLYWALALFNDIEDPTQVSAGTVLKIPATSTLWGYKGVLTV